MASRLFLDFDGTLVDPRRRLYRLFCELAPETTLSFDDYWQLKCGKMTQRQMLRYYLQYPDARVDAFRDAWMEKIEEPERLMIDTPFPGVTEFLAQASRQAALCLVTARQHRERLLNQIRRLGWDACFSDVLATAPRQSKAELIRSRLACGPGDWIVGDTGEDILAGKELGMRTAAVTSGVLSEAVLRTYQPDALLDSVVQLTNLLPPQAATAQP
jgi:phosphoglycolate phosphatase